MDWLNSMAAYGQEDMSNGNDGNMGEDEEDFYGNTANNPSLAAAGDTLPGATNANGQVNVSHIPYDLCCGEPANPRCF